MNLPITTRSLLALLLTLACQSTGAQQRSIIGERIGSWPGTPRGSARGVSLQRNLAFVALGEGGLAVFDVSTPTNALRLGGIDTAGYAYGVHAVGNMAYVADGSAGLQVLDVSNPSAPKRMGGIDSDGESLGVQVVGDYAYLADGTAGVVILDVSNPVAPRKLGDFNTKGSAYGLQVIGNLAYVADGSAGLQILDITQPRAPAPVGTYNTRGEALDLQVVGNLAYVADGLAGLEVLDVSNPAAPTRLGGFDTFGTASGVQVAGSTAYVASGPSGLSGFTILDVAQPGVPQFVTEYLVTGGDQTYGLKSDGGFLYVTSGTQGVFVFDLSNPSLPKQTGGFASGGFARGLQVIDNLAYLADGGAGLQVLNIADPTKPVRTGIFDTLGSAGRVQVVGGLAYLVDSPFGIRILDTLSSLAPRHLGSYSTMDPGGGSRGVQVVGDLGYVADGYAGLQVVDLRNPAAPVRLGGFDTDGNALGVHVEGNLAFVADGVAGLQVLDVSTPSGPRRLGTFDTPGAALDVRVVRNLAFVADLSGGLQIVDVRNPSAPARVGTFDTGGDARSVHLAGNLAYVTDGRAGVHVLDVSSPATPTRQGGFLVDGAPYEVQVAGNVAFVACGPGGLQIFRLRSGLTQSLSLVHPASLRATNPPITLSATSSSGLPVSLSVASGPGSIVGEQLTISGAGTLVIRIEQLGNDQYLPAVLERTITILKAPQTLSFVLPSSVILTNPPIELTAVASSGLPVTFRVVSGPGSLEGTRLTIAGKGEVVVRAEQPGNEQFSAVSVSRTLSGSGIPQTLVFELPPLVTKTDSPFPLEATSSSGLPVAFRILSGPGSLEGRQLTLTGPGTVVVRAEQAGNEKFLPASVERSLTVADCSTPLPVPVIGDVRVVGTVVRFGIVNADAFPTGLFVPFQGAPSGSGCSTNTTRSLVEFAHRYPSWTRLDYFCSPTTPSDLRSLSFPLISGLEAVSFNVAFTDRLCGNTARSAPFVIPWGTNLIEFATNRLVVSETQGWITIPIRRGSPANELFPPVGPLSVPFRTEGTATSGDDFRHPPAASVEYGAFTGTFRLRVVDDVVAEPDETIVLHFDVAGLSRVAAGAADTLTVVIVDNDGPGTPPFVLDAAPTNIVIQPDGRILVAGDFGSAGGAARPQLARLNPDLTLDPTFRPPTWIEASTIRQIAFQGTDHLLLTGTFPRTAGQSLVLRRLKANGADDPDFVPLDGDSGIINAGVVLRRMEVDGGGGILLAGSFSSADLTQSGRAAVRLLPDGSRDPAFASAFSALGLNSSANTVCGLPDGRWILGGSFRNGTSPGTTRDRNRIVRLLPDGNIDPSFQTDGGFSNVVNAVAIDRLGRVLASGRFSRFQTNPVPGWARLLPTGGFDDSFVPTSSGTNFIQMDALDDGRILALGQSILREFSEKGAELRTLATNVTTYALEPSGALLVGSTDLPRLRRIPIDSAPAPLVEFLHGRSTVSEGAGSVSVVVRRRGPVDSDAEVEFEVAGEGGVVFPEFTPSAGRLSFLPGVREERIELRLATSNAVPDAPRSLVVHLRAGRGVSIPPERADHRVYFSDDDIGLTSELFVPDPRDSFAFEISTLVTRLSRFHERLSSGRDEMVHFEWDYTGPRFGRTEDFALLWTGWLVPEVTGEYRLATTADDGTRIWLDDRLVLANWLPTTTKTTSAGPIQLERGRAYRLAVAYFEQAGNAHVRLQWQTPETNVLTTIPGHVLRPGVPRRLPPSLTMDWKPDPVGKFELSYLCEPGRPMRIEFSTNGVAWRALYEVVSAELGRPELLPLVSLTSFLHGWKLRGVSVDDLVAEVTVPLVVTSRITGSSSLLAGSTNQVRLDASANGGPGQIFRWWRDGSEVGTGSSLLLSGTNASTPGTYHATVQVADAVAASESRVISFLEPPGFGSASPRDLYVGEPAELAIPVFGSTPLSYAWYRDGVLIPAATNVTLVIPSVARSDTGTYTLAVTNLAGGATSLPLLVRVLDAPPRGPVLAIRDGQFSVDWTVPPGAYEWQEAEALGAWRPLLRTNLVVGPFQFVSPTPATDHAKFFRLMRIP